MMREPSRFWDEVLMGPMSSADSLLIGAAAKGMRKMALFTGLRGNQTDMGTTTRTNTGISQSAGAKPALTTTSPVKLVTAGVGEFKDRRRKRRVKVQPMYSSAIVRVLSKRDVPMEGHVVNLSETGMVISVDDKIGIGQPVTIEFQVSGLGRPKGEEWPIYPVAAEVVRVDDCDDFPGGPYCVAMRFVRIPTMVQAAIARFVLTQPD
jgi:hypothetical protein